MTKSATPNKNATDLLAGGGIDIPDTVEGKMLLAKKLTDRVAARKKTAKDLVAAHHAPPPIAQTPIKATKLFSTSNLNTPITVSGPKAWHVNPLPKP